MIRKIAILVVLLALTACVSSTVSHTNECPREGGIGGTGNGCPIEQPLTS
ncbi:hypothetical protein [Cochlodiniinecator piscidefendens]|nr:hypothetical protein [Cochlodiniinecator piscidefendens]